MLCAIADSGLASVVDVAQRRVPPFVVDRAASASATARWFGGL
jgi:hypothetical protein